MTQKKMLPRAMFIFRLKHESGKNQSKIFGRGTPQNRYLDAVKLKRLTLASFNQLAEYLNRHSKMNVTGAELCYDDETLSPADQLLRQLLELGTSHAVRKELSSKLTDYGLPDNPSGSVYLLLYLDGRSKNIRKELEEASQKWSEHEKADYDRLVNMLGQAVGQCETEAVRDNDPNDKLSQADSAARKALVDHAIQEVSKDQRSIDTLYAYFKPMNGRKDTPYLIELLFPVEMEDEAEDDIAPKTIISFLKLARHGLNGIIPPRDVLLTLRDVAICLSIPRKFRFNALAQYMQHEKIRELPSMDLLISKQIMCRAFGIMSKPKNVTLQPFQIQARIAVSNESIVDVDITSILGLANSGVLNEVQLPAGESLSENLFFEQFCQGLAKGINISFDRKDVQTLVEDINDMLKTYSELEIKVCVFLTQKRTEAEILKLNTEFPLVNFVRLSLVEPKELRTLSNNVCLADALLDGKLPAGGTTDIF